MDLKIEFLVVALLSALVSISPFIISVAFPDPLRNYTNPYGEEPDIINVYAQDGERCVFTGKKIDLQEVNENNLPAPLIVKTQSEGDAKIMNEVAKWIVPKASKEVQALYMAAPPCLEKGALMKLDKPLSGLEEIHYAVGTWYVGSNVIFVADSTEKGNEMYHHILHEQLHYASTAAYFINYENGSWWMIGWLGEGIAEHYTLRILEENGMQYDTDKFAKERNVADEIAAIVGEEELERAYLSGDFNTVRKRLDKRLGKDASDQLRKQPDAEHALEFLRLALESK